MSVRKVKGKKAKIKTKISPNQNLVFNMYRKLLKSDICVISKIEKIYSESSSSTYVCFLSSLFFVLCVCVFVHGRDAECDVENRNGTINWI